MFGTEPSPVTHSKSKKFEKKLKRDAPNVPKIQAKGEGIIHVKPQNYNFNTFLTRICYALKTL